MGSSFVINLIVVAALAAHCLRTGRNALWLWVLFLLPGAGALAYIAVELVPDLLHTRTAGRALRSARQSLISAQQLRDYEAAVKRTGDVASRQRYAEELLRQGRAPEAVEAYRQTLAGLYEHDPNLMLGLAQAQFAAGLAAAARSTLEDLRDRNLDFKSADAHLLYARALEAEGNLAKALQEYAAVAGYFAGAEAALRHARLQSKLGQSAAARHTLAALLEHARLAPRHYRQAQAPWLAAARRDLAAL